MVNDNMITVTVRPGRRVGDRAFVSTTPRNSYLAPGTPTATTGTSSWALS